MVGHDIEDDIAEVAEAKLTCMTASVRTSLDSLKKNTGGAFWHKTNYPNQQCLDGLYMTEPFLAAHASR